MSGWQVWFSDGTTEVVDGKRLRELAGSGRIAPDTKVKSLSKNKMGLAGEIPGLFSHDATKPAVCDAIDSLPPPVQSPWKAEPKTQKAVQDLGWAQEFSRRPVRKQKRTGFFDIRFDSFITVDLVSLAWQFALWFILFACLLQIFLVVRFVPLDDDVSIKSLQIGAAVILSAAFGCFAALVARVFLEAIVVLFKIEEHLRG